MMDEIAIVQDEQEEKKDQDIIDALNDKGKKGPLQEWFV